MPERDSNPTQSSREELSSTDPLKISRRSFGRRAASVAALSLSPGTLLAAAGTQSNPGTDDNAKLGITPEQAAEVDAKLASIVRKFGSRLSDEQRQHLRRILAYNERMLAGVRAFALQNGDPPASVLKVSYAKENTAHEARRGVATKPAGAGKNQEGAH